MWLQVGQVLEEFDLGIYNPQKMARITEKFDAFLSQSQIWINVYMAFPQVPDTSVHWPETPVLETTQHIQPSSQIHRRSCILSKANDCDHINYTFG